ncbi:recombinase family protein [Cytobacillus sp. IB215316]|uniref:recombinase family protein n=1 Tax=Cytobacillus sp. IB215316 TaxID=3097354 RepID=UPI002A13CA3A|nr:recombinase family protein [Cytobacillus sp. IB215316]MDX8359796.1 recombinase family protein [Cytobacillus sp. IB215316]
METVAIYLRKSRADLEAEARGEGETLAKHKKTLLKVAREKKLNISIILEEIVSGESLMKRPEMLRLLEEVEKKSFNAVLVMDMDRLGRGNMQEQGLILETFRSSNTKIITPRKTYDLTNEFDEEYSEFESFMARRELKLITRRMQRGRVASIEAGNYIGSVAPYGYKKIKTQHNEITLEPDVNEAPIVKIIFDMYVNQDQGTGLIAKHLNNLGIPTRKNSKWIVATIRDILQNPIYIGKVKWNTRPEIKTKVDGELKTSRPRANKDQWKIVDGKHSPLVEEDIFYKAKEIFISRKKVRTSNGKITNPLAGIIRCGMCNSAMVRRPYKNQPAHIICSNQLCSNKSSRFEYVELKLIKGIEQCLLQYKTDLRSVNRINNENESLNKEDILKSIQQEKSELLKQQDRLHDFLERGVYSEETFLERNQKISLRLQKVNRALEKIQEEITAEQNRYITETNIVPKVETNLRLYLKTKDPSEKNKLLKLIVHQAVYTKDKTQRLDDFSLEITPTF